MFAPVEAQGGTMARGEGAARTTTERKGDRMPETDMILYPEREQQDPEAHEEDVHGVEVKVTRKGDPEGQRADLREEMLQDEDVAVDPDGEFVIDETGQRVFVPYPTLGPRQTPREQPDIE
jgi:hypothetical protein